MNHEVHGVKLGPQEELDLKIFVELLDRLVTKELLVQLNTICRLWLNKQLVNNNLRFKEGQSVALHNYHTNAAAKWRQATVIHQMGPLTYKVKVDEQV